MKTTAIESSIIVNESRTSYKTISTASMKTTTPICSVIDESGIRYDTIRSNPSNTTTINSYIIADKSRIE